jgi:hypothetical protein
LEIAFVNAKQVTLEKLAIVSQLVLKAQMEVLAKMAGKPREMLEVVHANVWRDTMELIVRQPCYVRLGMATNPVRMVELSLVQLEIAPAYVHLIS